MSVLRVEQVAAAIAVLGGIGTTWLAIVRNRARREWAELREHHRAYRAHYAAVEAAEDDPSFSPDAIERAVTDVVVLAECLWRGEKTDAIRRRPDAGLIRAWAQSRRSRLGDGLRVRRKPSVDLLRVVNRDDEEEDRVVARVRLHVHCRHPRVGLVATRYMHLDERWTFGRNDDRWVLLSVEGDPLTGPVLTAPLVPNPSLDDERLSEEGLAEVANAHMVGDDVDLSGLVGADEPPALALADLSVVDVRFMPALIAAQLRHLVEAWEDATTGSEAPLSQLASTEATKALLRPGGGTRFVIRDAVLSSWEPSRLDLARRPPAIDVVLHVEAVRFVVDLAGGHRAGNDTDTRVMALRWTLELTHSTQRPWRLIHSDNPSTAIPGL